MREPQTQYTKDSYRRAVLRGVDKANKRIREDADHFGIDYPALVPIGTRTS